ncbi:MAG: septal ring lytic transglycosylase RlpA family lipoprotein [Desulfuromonas sp.]|nr:MAG: septal ring lytic transglycosylase RlpA family lipoprotein [Desulfuromonas sp.]
MRIKSFYLKTVFICLLLILFPLSGCGPSYNTRVLDTPETVGLKGHEKPYIVNGERYDPLRDHSGFEQEGIASWYGKDFHGKKTSNGEIYNMHAMTAAHKTLPLGVYVEVANKNNGRRAVVRVNDRGPFVAGRIIDLSYAAAKDLGVVGPGTAPVRIAALGYRATDRASDKVFTAPKSWDVGSYTVQLGAFADSSNAYRFADKMRKKTGFATVTKGWVKGRMFHRVWAGKFTSLEQAELAKIEFAAEGLGNGFVVALE